MGYPTKAEARPPHRNPTFAKGAIFSPGEIEKSSRSAASPTGSDGSSISSAREFFSESCRSSGSSCLAGRARLAPSLTRSSSPEEEEEEESPISRGLNASLGGLIRSSMARQSRSASPLQDPEGDQAPGSSRAKNIIHLRRLLDPWLKPRKVAAGSPGPSLRESSPSSSCRSGDGDVSSSSRWVSLAAPGSIHEADQEMKQSLLRLTWKNGFPLFTFSVNESDILAATRKAGSPSKEDSASEFSYTFYSVHEGEKKKNGGWVNQGKKSGRKELISSVAAQMTISSRETWLKEFILFAPEGESTELAAISARVPRENTKTCAATEPNVVVVLPSQAHGQSDKENGGRPSPLLDRWRSGGLCDCGGWDVGCALTVLRDHLQETDFAHRVEFVFQGGSSEGRPAFSLVVFKEGLYTVDFHASIGPLQAFAICVSLLHCRVSAGLRSLRKEHK